MDVYFDLKLQLPQAGTHSDIFWHPSAPLLAICTHNEVSGGSVNIFNKEGERQQHATVQRSCQPSAASWNPQKKILACGWENGEVVVWNEAERELHEVPKLHTAAITSVIWSSKGSRLVTADENGRVIVWKADGRGRLAESPLHQHNIQEGVKQLLLRPLIASENAVDITALARAAVSGDESALDMFNWKKGVSNKSSAALSLQEATSFYVGSENGTVYYCSENGRLTQPFKADGPIRRLLYHPSKDVLVTITVTLVLTQHSVSADGDVKEMMKVKLSGKVDSPSLAWGLKGILLTATGEGVLRAWDLDNDSNFVLSLDRRSGYDANETVNCVCFNKAKGMITGGTNLGNVAMWKFSPSGGSKEANDETCWRLQPPATVGGSIKQITWATADSVMAATTGDNVFLLTEQVLCSHFNDGVAMVQTGPHALSVNIFESSAHHEVKADIQIKGVFATKDGAVLWNGKRVVVFEYTADKNAMKPSGSWACDTTVACAHQQSVYTFEGQKLQIRTIQGTVKQTINFADTEGIPCCMDACGAYLTVGTTIGVVKVYDLSFREAKAHCNPKNVAENIPHFGTLLAAKCSCNGKRVSLQIMKSDGKPDPRLYIWDTERNAMQFFNFETGRGEQDDDTIMPTKEQESELSDTERGRNQAARDISLRYPVRHFWDLSEPRLLVCEAKRISTAPAVTSADNALQQAESLIVSLFTTPEYGTLIQDSFPMSKHYSCLLGMEVPYYVFVVKSDDAAAEAEPADSVPTTPRAVAVALSPSHHVARKVMRDFVGLEKANKSSRDAMMNFSFFLAAGNLDEAFKAIKVIKSEAVWENLAKMCVKTRRLDVASVCLGNMCHARGAKALREAASYPELDARVAVLALHLGMLEEAEMLLKNCKRYDLLNELYQANGHWSEAMSVAEAHDRIHLRTTYYNYAKHLEEKGDLSGAIPHYEKSDTHRFEVPRMLFDEPQALEAYITKTKDKALRKWWAQYQESTGEMETALQYYEAAQDYLSLVRVYCYCGNLDKAAEICNDMGDKAACYQLARTYETQSQIKEAIHFFTRAQAYGNAVRLCKEHGMDDQLFNLALLGTAEDMLEAARYYEQKRGCQDKAVMLYHKAGSFSKALDLAFEAKLFGALQMVSESLTDKTDPEVLKRCATFFLENGQFDKAVDLLAVGQKFAEALRLCVEQHVLITEELAEKLTPQKAAAGVENDAERVKVLEAIAEVCMQQRQYHLATKKFTQAGNRIKAMKALLKSGDTEKIIFFAGVSRQKEIYVMAGNYLQSLDWRKDPEIMKNIIGFYTKGKALDSLASFYEACAQVEIDDYQNYEKAVGALSEASKCLAKAKMKNAAQQEEKLATLKQQMSLIKKFVNAKRIYEEDTEDAMKQCQILLEEPNINESVRIGDLYGFMIQHYAQKEKYKLAYNLMEELRSKMPSINMAFFIDMRTIEAIHKDLGIPLGRGIGADKLVNGHRQHAGTLDTNGGDEVDEDVMDELDNEC